MDENNSNVNRLDTVLGVQEDKSVGSKIKAYIKKFNGIPESREVRLTARANFRKANRDLNKQLKTWDRLGKRQVGAPLLNYLFGDKARVKATKRVFAELEATAKKSSAKYNARLNALQGDDRLDREKNGMPYGGLWGDTTQAIGNNGVAIMDMQEHLEQLRATRDKLLASKKELELLPNEKTTLAAIEKAQKELNVLIAKRDELASKKIATKEDEVVFASLSKQLKSWGGRKGAQVKKLNVLRNQHSESPTEETSIAINKAELELNKIQNEIDRLTSDKEVTSLHLKTDKNRKAQLENADASIEQTRQKIKTLQNDLKNISADNGINDIVQQLEQNNIEITEAEQNLKQMELQSRKLEKAFEDIESEIADINNELNLMEGDLKSNPFKVILMAKAFKNTNNEIDNINVKTKKWYEIFKKSNVVTRLISRTMINIRSQISDMLNPFTKFRMGWDAWLDRWDNLPWKNTFDVIGYNLVTAFEPVFKWLAQALIKVAQIANVFIQRWTGVNLFDKSAWQLEQIKKGMGQLTASFDELHSNNDNPNQFNTIFDTDPSQITPLNSETVSKLTKAADTIKKIWDGVTGFIKEHPLASAIIGGMAALFGPGIFLGLGKLALKGIAGIGKLLGKGFSKMFPNLTAGIKGLGTKITGLLGKELYTGAGALGTKAGVTLGKALLGGTMAIAGTAGSILIGANAGKNWEDLGTGMKIASVAGSGLMAGMAGLGAVMLGASGPVGWAVAGVVALASLTVGMAQTQDGISSIKDQTEQLTEAQNIAKTANDNYLISMNNLANTMSQLEQLEQQTGLSGAQLAEQVKNGVLQVDNMTTAQLQVYNAYLQNEEMIKQLKIATEQKTEADKQAAIKALELEAANAIASDSYDDLLTSVKTAMEEGSISATEGADIMSRALANASNEVQDEFRNKIPEAMKEGFDPDKYESAFRTLADNIGQWFKGLGEKISGWWEGVTQNSGRTFKGFMADVLPGGKTSTDFPSYDVGTNYVPNDQLAMVHKGEAIIPAKYNKPYSPASNNSNLENTVSAMTQEIANLRSLIQAGIPVKGEFKQRGSDLVAVVEKGKNRNGNSTLSNPAYAR